MVWLVSRTTLYTDMSHLRRSRILVALPFLLVVLVACGPGSVRTSVAPVATTKGEASAATLNSDLLARHLPQVIYRGGLFLRHPRIVTVTFAGEDPGLASRLEQFGNAITLTPWWRAVTEGYCAKDGDCIGEGQPGFSVRLPETLASKVHAVDISALLRHHAQAGHLGVLDSNTLILVYLPKGVGLKDAFIPSYCGDGPRAYHKTLRFDNKAVGYAVMPRCSDEATLTGTASHELLEITTNPDIAKRGFSFVQSSANLGFTASGIEAMDPCGFITLKPEVVESGFVVRRSWSNRAATQGHDPCVPTDTEKPYFALVPRRSTVRLANIGDSVKVTLDAAASRPVPEWTVSTFDLTGTQEHDQYVKVSLDRSAVASGQTATLTITLHKRHPKSLGVVGIVSTMGDYTYIWPVAVGMR